MVLDYKLILSKLKNELNKQEHNSETFRLIEKVSLLEQWSETEWEKRQIKMF